MDECSISSRQEDVLDFTAYIPCYDGGNFVMAIKKDGQTTLIKKSIRAVIDGLLKERSISFKYLKKNFHQFIGGTNIIPLPLGLGIVLIPVKIRKPVGRNDGAYAYIDLSYIKDVAEDNGTVINLKCNFIINCIETMRTVRCRMKNGKQFEEKFVSSIIGEQDFKDGLDDIRSEYDRAATKRDITMLAYEIMKLRKEL